MNYPSSLDPLQHYLSKFKASTTTSSSSAEGTIEDAEIDIKVKERLESADEGISRIIESQRGHQSELADLKEKILKESEEPLQALSDRNARYFSDHPQKASLLEVIVRTDGSRPSFLIKNDKVDLTSSPVGNWEGAFVNSADLLKTAIQSVGRINIGAIHIGTGFLIHENLILTNRHVLQRIAQQDNQQRWSFVDGAHIDFGYEFKTRVSVNPRRLVRVVFYDPRKIEKSNIDHKKLDMVIIEIETVPPDQTPKNTLVLESSTSWAFPDSTIFIIGYPADPGSDGVDNYGSKLLHLLFGPAFGSKRIAPGKIIDSGTGVSWTVSHDASTLGGNSGSLVVSRPNEDVAAGIHYGGDLMTPRQNWAHDLAYVFKGIKTGNPAIYEQLSTKLQFVAHV